MTDVVIRAESLSKRYSIGAARTYRTLRESLVETAMAPFSMLRAAARRRRTAGNDAENGATRSIWALRDVSFEVRRGEVVGVVGSNGAGKSTLLKILSRITAPTRGVVDMVGRVGSLLEVGTGFHPELTGRENIYLNGAILGMPQAQIRRRFDDIVAFSEVDEFIDTPVKRFSSGMYMRLAFAVAAHLEPDILVIDEVLAVGDVAFQRKCMRKMDNVAKEGHTVLFVSHNMGIVRQLCSRGVLLDRGRMVLQGPIDEVVAAYERDVSAAAGEGSWVNPELDTGDLDAYLRKIEVTSADGSPVSEAFSSEALLVHLDIFVHKPSELFKVGFDLIKSGTVVFRLHQVDALRQPNMLERCGHRVTCRIPPHLLNLGEYYILPQMSIHCLKGLTRFDKPVLRFTVRLDTAISSFHGVLDERNHPGVIFPILEWTTSRKD